MAARPTRVRYWATSVRQALNVAAVALGAKLPDGYDSRVYDVGPNGEIEEVWPLFRIELLFRDEKGDVFRSRTEDFILNQVEDKVMPHRPWAYTGSYFSLLTRISSRSTGHPLYRRTSLRYSETIRAYS
ncbi:MAG: hypothetical protein U5N86_03670 [Planctomycetota bacterium]|nr:hypothetical protein [Planctomycetota bacterium]